LIINWSTADLNATGLVRDWNASGDIIDWNSTGYIKDWDVSIVAANATMANYVDGTFLTSETDPLAYNGTLAYNSTFDDYYQLSNPFGYYNSTNPSPVINTSYYLVSNPFGYYNVTTLPDLNSSGLIIDWNVSGYIKDWDPNSYIKDWNSTGYIKNWQVSIVDANTTMATYVNSLNHDGITWATATNGTLALVTDIPTDNDEIDNGR